MGYLLVVVNTCFGGFGLSKKAYEFLDIPWDGYGYIFDEDRCNPDLIRVVASLGEEASGSCANLEIVSCDYDYEIEEYDGREYIPYSCSVDIDKVRDNMDIILKHQKIISDCFKDISESEVIIRSILR